ncbi:MAG: hypothetical protein ACMUIG_03135 [Thermoplasmatota archaeon]
MSSGLIKVNPQVLKKMTADGGAGIALIFSFFSFRSAVIDGSTISLLLGIALILLSMIIHLCRNISNEKYRESKIKGGGISEDIGEKVIHKTPNKLTIIFD